MLSPGIAIAVRELLVLGPYGLIGGFAATLLFAIAALVAGLSRR